ncbi:MAG: Endo,4-beta-xylanase precursor, partial [Verrucomicrobiota bacterium]
MFLRFLRLPFLALALTVAVPHLPAAGLGLVGEYFDNSDFTTLRLTTTNASINFDWGTNAPAAGVGADTFSVRWSGQVEARFSETCTFHVLADDGARLWVNDRLLLVRTAYSASGLEMSGTLALQAGRRYNLVLEYIENTGNARVQLDWSSPSQPRETIPQAQLYPVPALPEAGSLLKEVWTGLAGTDLAALTNQAAYPARPNGREFIASFECLQPNWTNDYGTRVTGFLLPSISGSYTFAVAGADTVSLHLSPTTNAADRTLIASVTNATGFRQFSNAASQVSAPVTLAAGQRYYVELLHKAGTTDDHFSVAWRPPGASNLTVIPADVLIPSGLHRAPLAQSAYFDSL